MEEVMEEDLEVTTFCSNNHIAFIITSYDLLKMYRD